MNVSSGKENKLVYLVKIMALSEYDSGQLSFNGCKGLEQARKFWGLGGYPRMVKVTKEWNKCSECMGKV